MKLKRRALDDSIEISVINNPEDIEISVLSSIPDERSPKSRVKDQSDFDLDLDLDEESKKRIEKIKKFKGKAYVDLE